MAEPHDWPLEQPAKGTVRPWYVTATGYLAVLFREHEEAERAQRGLQEHGVPEQDLRLYGAEETLRLWSRVEEERSILAKAVAALVADRPARERYLSNARSGGSALWIVVPTKERADRLVGLLADWRYVSMRYFGEDGLGRHRWGRRLTPEGKETVMTSPESSTSTNAKTITEHELEQCQRANADRPPAGGVHPRPVAAAQQLGPLGDGLRGGRL